MPTKIQEIEDAERNRTILRVEGEMFFEDAILLEKIALGMREQNGKKIAIDLADLHFLDSEGAPILKRMIEQYDFEIEGMLTFLQRAVEQTENRSEPSLLPSARG